MCQALICHADFQVLALQALMSRLRVTSIAEATGASLTHEILNGIARLSNDIRNMPGDLPTYDQRTCSEVR